MTTPVDIMIETADGQCRSWFFRPAEGDGPWPGVMLFMDAIGIRPAKFEMAQALADMGYVVLLPDLFYRLAPYEPCDESRFGSDTDYTTEYLVTFAGHVTGENVARDAPAFIDTLAAHSDVCGDRFGCTGYCMGGGVAMVVAGAEPERIAAAASFHGGGLVTRSPFSPHLFASKMKGRLYVALAVDDPFCSDRQKQMLEQALKDAGVDFRMETYDGCHHGFAIPGGDAFSPGGYERHWAALRHLFGETLPG